MSYMEKNLLKKIKKISITLSFGFLLTSCNNEPITLERPSDTNLEFWITQPINSRDDFKNCTFLPGLFGGDMYLDSRYKVSFDEHYNYTLPLKYVVYTVTSYPDLSSDDAAITNIKIKDPSIHFYNLSSASSKEEIKEVMEKEGFKIKEELSINNSINYYKNNTIFTFTDSYISISAHVSNKNGIQF